MKIHPAHALLPAILMAIIVLVVVTQNLGSVQAMGVTQENQPFQAEPEVDEHANQALEPLNGNVDYRSTIPKSSEPGVV